MENLTKEQARSIINDPGYDPIEDEIIVEGGRRSNRLLEEARKVLNMMTIEQARSIIDDPGYDPIEDEIIVEGGRRSNKLLEEARELLNIEDESSIEIYEEVELREYQIDHYDRINEILDNNWYYLDGTETGGGKTYVAAKIAQERGLPCIVISPKSLRYNWKSVFNKYGIDTVLTYDGDAYITYAGLRSMGRKQPKNGLLRKYFIFELNAKDEYTEVAYFEPTQFLLDLIDEGIFIIIDEYQNGKNNSIQNRAIRALLSEIKYSDNSIAALLSASPFDKEEHAINVLNLVSQFDNYIKVNSSSSRLQTVDEILENVPEMTKLGIPLGSSVFESFVFNYYILYIKDEVQSIMDLSHINYNKDIKNGFYYINDEDYVKFLQLIDEINENIEENNLPSISIFRELQLSKAKAMARVAREMLENETNSKVILYADFYDVIDILMEELEDYEPIELTGRIKEDDRIEGVELFQEDSNEFRVIIGNPKVGGIGLSLHDIYGGRPRYMFIMSNYNTIDLHQSAGRIYRDGLIRGGFVRFFYGITDSRSEKVELNLIQKLIKKGSIIKRTVKEQNNVFPSDYENWFENERSKPKTFKDTNNKITNTQNKLLRLYDDLRFEKDEEAKELIEVEIENTKNKLNELIERRNFEVNGLNEDEVNSLTIASNELEEEEKAVRKSIRRK